MSPATPRGSVRLPLVDQEPGSEHGEGMGFRLLGAVPVDVGPARAMTVRRDVQRDLNVVEAVLQHKGGDELLSNLQSTGVA